MTVVYCPKCGEQMTRDSDGNLACSSAGNWLSPRMQMLLPQFAESGPVDPATTGTSVKWGAGWHCPADGQVMVVEPGGVACPDCGRRLIGSLIYELTEFNPHVRVGESGSGS